MLMTPVLLVVLLAAEPSSLPAEQSISLAPPQIVLAQEQTPAPAAQTPAAQEPAPPPDSSEEKKPPTPVHTGVRALFFGLLEDVKHLPSIRNAQFAALGGGVALVAHPFDEKFNIRLRSHYN